ncbi:coiled-coil domain-containing protein [Microtetraspora malaysiensis]|uniref:coiled-coil domain-containing protein n=1 Tax=Microtetraspora malaysiensis TaxID=161358 RepID=UPI003D89E082
MVSLAGLRYQTHDLGLFGTPDLQGAAVLAQLQDEQAVVVSQFATLKAERKAAADAAAALITEIKTRSEEVARQRKDAEKLIDDIRAKLDQLIPIAPGRRSAGGWAPELPSGSDNITPRTRLMKEQVSKNFDLKFTVGCYRAENDGGEHPLGRACDFMMSSGGSMPSPGMKALGDSVAAWVIKNGSKLGVKYVIWQQRIYNLGSPGWRTMSNRGGVTANHYDHVHISMY